MVWPDVQKFAGQSDHNRQATIVGKGCVGVVEEVFRVEVGGEVELTGTPLVTGILLKPVGMEVPSSQYVRVLEPEVAMPIPATVSPH
jgi:hypothetical protein